MESVPLDRAVRLAAFEFVRDQVERHGDVLPHSVLVRGFDFEGQRVPLLGPQGIFKPAILPDMPLSISTAPPEDGKRPPYEDRMADDGTLEYCYRGTDPAHRDNRGLRLAMTRRAPLIYLRGLVPGRYFITLPVFVVGDDPSHLRFRVAVDEVSSLTVPADSVAEGTTERRAYLTVTAQKRLHQQSFRERVLRAYHTMCAICRLRHGGLLDAAHILPDGHPRGDPVVPNGLALCRLHHAAFDQNLLGLRPDLRVEIRPDILDEEDGPMLVHGFQGFQGSHLHVPRSRDLQPDPARVAERYARFREAS